VERSQKVLAHTPSWRGTLYAPIETGISSQVQLSIKHM
jgi:hypothetical protein